LRLANPRLVTASIHLDRIEVTDDSTPRRGLAIVAEAESGILRSGRWAASDDRPREFGTPLGDFTAGLTAYSAIVTSLFSREANGVGGHHEIGMLESLVSLNTVDVVNAQFAKENAGHKLTAGYGIFRTSDGWITIGVNSDVLWKRLVGVMGRDDLAEDPRYAGYGQRDTHSVELGEIIEAWSSVRPAREILEGLSQAGVPCGKVNRSKDLLADADDLGYRIFDAVDDGLGGHFDLPANSMGYERDDSRYPDLGQHTNEVLTSWLGVESNELEALAAAGVFGDIAAS
jgi:crotonobetainyl-CoA:carnitine CoA-transferase CaiB-like acyl-CoA transferase